MKLLAPVRPLFLTVVALAAIVGSASAFGPRVPQVTTSPASLQGYFNSVGEAINVTTDQVDAQKWSTTISGNSTFTIMIEFAGNAASNNIGIYNVPDAVPALFQVFPGAASPGWHALCHFGGGNVIVSLFDKLGAFQGQTTYNGVNANNFGFYLQGPGGTFYSEDSRNGGSAQMITFLGTGANAGSWWNCFEDLPYAGSDGDFDDAVLFVESANPTPAIGRTWGGIKALYSK
jgi:hypothetical protein